MSGPSHWDDKPVTWDALYISGHLAPGIVDDISIDRSFKVDEKGGAGVNGATLTVQGLNLASVTIKIKLWTRTHVLKADQLVYSIFLKPKQTKLVKPFDFGYPLLETHGLRSLLILDVSGPTKPDDSGWRALDDGSIWVGFDDWPALDIVYQVLSEEPSSGRLVIATDAPTLRPGVTLDKRRITRVDHVVEADRVRTEVEYTKDPEHGSIDRLLESFAKVVRRVMRNVRMHARYVGSVVGTNSNGTVSVKLDGTAMPGSNTVPLRYGVPGLKAKLPSGTRCAMQFDEGDATRPVITGYEGDAVQELVFDGGTKGIARVDDTVDAGHLVIVGSPVTAITYFPPGTLPTPAPPGAVIALSGVIASGNPKFKA